MSNREKLDIINEIINKYFEYDLTIDDDLSFIKGYLESALEAISIVTNYSDERSCECIEGKKILNE